MQPFIVYWSSILIGVIFGFVAGVALSFFVVWVSDREWEAQNGNIFSRGFNSGWECGKEHQQLINMTGKDDAK